MLSFVRFIAAVAFGTLVTIETIKDDSYVEEALRVVRSNREEEAFEDGGIIPNPEW